MAKTNIFESTQVVFNLEFLSLIPKAINQATFFIELAEEMELTFCEQIDNGCPVLLGLWDNVLKAEKKLEELLQSWTEDSHFDRDPKEANPEPVLPSDARSEIELGPVTPEAQNTTLETCVVESSMILTPESCSALPPKSDHTDLSNYPQLYFFSSDASQLQTPQIFYYTLRKNCSTVCSTVQNNNPTDEKMDGAKGLAQRFSQVSQLKSKENETDVKEIYVDIAVNPVKRKSTKKQSSVKYNNKKSSENQHPLDKLCQLLCIEEDEHVDKRVSKSEKHKKSDETPYKFFCDQCSFKAKRENHLVKHAKLHEKVKDLFYCDQCDFKTIRESVLCRHKLQHATDELLCKLCSYKTDNMSYLLRHIRVRHGSNSKKKLKCNVCDYLAPSLLEIKIHRNLFHKKENLPKMWKCLKCPYKSKLRAHLTRHENDVHGSLRQFLCHYCGKVFKRNDTLTQHKAIHGEINKTYTCQTCGKVCTSSVFLREHLASHTTERPFLCDVCGSSFKTRSATQRHKRAMHPANNTLLSCTQCGCIFKSRPDLNRHKKIHRCKPTASVVPAVTSGASVQAELISTPINIQVVYTSQLETNNQDVSIK